MEILFSSIGTGFLAIAFGLFVKASDVQDKATTISSSIFLWLSLTSLLLAIGAWSTAAILIRKRERKQEKKDLETMEHLQLEIDRLKREKPYPRPGAL
jgi:hypothetical protein